VAGRSAAFARGIFGAVSILVFASMAASALAVQGAMAAPQLAPGTPDQLRAAAADTLATALAKGGSGVRFEVIQTQTLQAKPNGPKVDVPDPADPRKTLRYADSYQIAALLEHGQASADGFFSEMLAGPAEGARPDWDHAQVLFSALVTSGERWRNDGEGWYRADALPGIGLDPETAVLLPSLLRNVTSVADTGNVTPPDDSIALRAIDGAAETADVPGVVAAGGERFTKLTEPVTFGFDAAGRLAWLRVAARNTNSTVYDLVVETEVRLAYDAVPAIPASDGLVLAPKDGTR
jgi:hypothetical protein